MSKVVSRDYSTPEAIWHACEEIGNTNPQDFASIKHEDGTLDLSDAVPIIERIVAFYKRVQVRDILMVPETRQAIFSTEVRNIQHVFEQIPAMKYRKAVEVRDKLIEAFHSTRSELTPFVSPPVQIPAAMQELRKSLENIRRMETEAANVLSGLREGAKDVGIANFVEVFAASAARHGNHKWWWLVALLVVSVSTGVVAWFAGSWLQVSASDGIPIAIQMVAVKLFIFGTMSYLILMTGRGYRAAAHNQVVNEHRRDALRSFMALGEATSDKATKNAVLIQATHAIFSYRPSGFGHRENDTIPPSHVLELTRGVIGDRGDAR